MMPVPSLSSVPTVAVAPDWRDVLPDLSGRLVTLRELEPRDAPSLLALLTTDEVTRFISPPPTTVAGFERFIAWARQQRRCGAYVCFAVVPHGMDAAVGVFQIRRMEPGYATAEWGFAIGSLFWGTGIFEDGAQLAVEFAFETIGITRLEARAAVANGRGNGALRKLGGIREAVLRRAFLCRGEWVDQVLWSILESEWRQTKPVRGRRGYVN